MTTHLRENSAILGGRGRRLAGACFAVLLLAGCAKPEPPPLPERPDIAFGQGRIWQIDRAGQAPSYLFGTLHVTDPRVRDLPLAVEEAFARAEIAAFEITHEPDEEMDSIGIERVKLPEGTTLRSLIGTGHFGKLTYIMKGRGYYKPRNDLKPWVFWEFLGGAKGTFYGNDREYDPDNPVLDDWLEERAREGGKEVVALETREESFAIFDGMPMDVQVALLQTALEHYHERSFGVPRVQFYLDGDLAMSRALWQERLGWLEPEAAKVLNDRLLDDRNRKMVERMTSLMEEGSTFVAVGAAHMAGEQGMLRLLERQGYTVTRLH